MSRFVDLSHPIVAGMTTYPRIPGPTMPVGAENPDTASGQLIRGQPTELDSPSALWVPRTVSRPLSRVFAATLWGSRMSRTSVDQR